MYQIMAYLCCFLLREVISPRGQFFNEDGAIEKNHRALCECDGSIRPYEPQREKQREDYDLDFL